MAILSTFTIFQNFPFIGDTNRTPQLSNKFKEQDLHEQRSGKADELMAQERKSKHVYLYRPIRLTQCCTKFRSLGVKVLCVFHFHDNIIAFTFK